LRQKTPVHPSHAARTAASGISSWQRTASPEADLPEPRVALGATTPGLPDASTKIRATARLVDELEVESDPGFTQPGERLVRLRVPAYGADHRHLGVEPSAGDRLVRALASRKSQERRATDRLAGVREPFAARDEVEIDRAYDDDARRCLRHNRSGREGAQIVDRRAEQGVLEIE
jgi:hypothetical protein